MELFNEIFPPLPNINDIKEEDEDLSVEEFDTIKKEKIQSTLVKHLKIPDWTSCNEEYIEVLCNFNHRTQMLFKNIINGKVRCSECRSNIKELSEILYSDSIDRKLFIIKRINKYGQVVLLCKARNHKMRIEHSSQKETPEYCPECIIEGSLTSDNEDDVEEDVDEEYLGYESCTLHNNSEEKCCSDQEYENYFDSLQFDDPNEIEYEISEELKDSQINHIISTVISKNHIEYIGHKEMALDQIKDK